MQPLLTELLNLDGIEVENYWNYGDHIVLEVEAKTGDGIDSGILGHNS